MGRQMRERMRVKESEGERERDIGDLSRQQSGCE